jgi:hypothetical protein
MAGVLHAQACALFCGRRRPQPSQQAACKATPGNVLQSHLAGQQLRNWPGSMPPAGTGSLLFLHLNGGATGSGCLSFMDSWLSWSRAEQHIQLAYLTLACMDCIAAVCALADGCVHGCCSAAGACEAIPHPPPMLRCMNGKAALATSRQADSCAANSQGILETADPAAAGHTAASSKLCCWIAKAPME